MIVRRSESAVLAITQPDHAALAGRVMREWRHGLPESPRRDDILRAIDEHDNGWREVDQAPIVDASTGRLLDFINAPDDVRQGVWPRGIERLDPFPYSAALVAQHAIHIYHRYRDKPGWDNFFSDMEARRARHLSNAPDRSMDELLRDYRFVRIGDLISLVFCNAWTEPQTEGEFTIRLDGDRVVVSPDPFEGRQVLVEVRAVELPDRPFASPTEANRAFDAGPRRRVSGVVCGSSRR